jgi:hypothetical protein
MQYLGDTVQQAGDVAGKIVLQERERASQEELANKVAMSDFTKQKLELRNQVGPDGAGYQEQVLSKYDEFYEGIADTIEDDDTRTEYLNRMKANRANISSEAATYEFGIKSAYSKDEANTAISTLRNRIMTDPTQYDTLVQQGNDVIDARPDWSESLKADAKLTWKYDSARDRFEGKLNSVRTVEDLDAISMELAKPAEGGKDWAAEMLPQDLDALLGKISTTRKVFQTRNDTDANAALADTEERVLDNLTPIPTDEMAQVQTVVKRSSNPAAQARMARLVDAQSQIDREKRLPPAELRAVINSRSGNPGAYPGLPVELSDAANKASEAFGESPALLGAMAQREYGSYLVKPKPRGKDEFKPQPINNQVDLRNIRQDVVDAATLAGEMSGSPLMLTYGGSTSPTRIDIVTVGKPKEEITKIVGALVDSGFTGFQETDGRLTASFEQAVPSTFGERDGQPWGGWSHLSPETMAVLKERGFAPGAKGDIIKRNPSVPNAPGIDYGRTTGIKDENGNPTSGAVGLMQFTKGTWLQVIKSPGVAEAIGVDTAGMTDADLLEMRKDPEKSMMMAAAYAASNRKSLEGVLGRDVTDAEVYMSHFLGQGGFMSLLRGYENQPEQPAADLLPSAAKKNKPVFYNKDGTPKTVREIYDGIGIEFGTAPTKIAFERNQTSEKLLAQTEKQLKEDPVGHAMRVGTHSVIPLSEEGGWKARGPVARAIAEYNKIPLTDMKPLMPDDLAYIKSELAKNDIETSLGLVASVQSMGAEVSRAAMKQLGETDATFSHAGRLFLSGKRDVAEDILRGRKAMQENPDLKKQLGQTDEYMSTQFTAKTGNALLMVPALRQTAQEAAMNLYVQRKIKTGNLKWDEGLYEESINAVLSGSNGKAIDDVNGTEVYLPEGISARQMKQALMRMDITDAVRLSHDGQPPRMRDGGVPDMADVADEVQLRYMGGKHYRLMFEDGSYLVSGDNLNKPYILVAEPKEIQKLALKPGAPVRRPNAGRGAQ